VTVKLDNEKSEKFYVENPTIFQDRARVVEKSGSKKVGANCAPHPFQDL
jgi:hypothetical protein